MKLSLSTLLLSIASLLPLAPAHADTLADIKARGELVVGMEISYKPFEYFQDGKAVGYDIDTLQIMADALGVKLKTVDTAWAGIVPALLEKKFDAVLSGMTITADRLKKVNFSNPTSIGSVVFLVRKDDARIQTAADTSDKIVATQLGSAADRVSKAYQAKLVAAGKPGYKEFKLYDTFPDAYVELGNKRIDAVAGALPVLQVVVHDRPGRFKIIGGIQDIEAYNGMAIRKEDEALLKFANEQIKTMKSSGKMAELQKKWFGDVQNVPDTIPADLP
jgi:polar amino acid transport system substrate-binding protein